MKIDTHKKKLYILTNTINADKVSCFFFSFISVPCVSGDTQMLVSCILV